jgi:hypothetical protein
MPIDMRRVALAAVQAALEDPSPGSTKNRQKKKSHLSTGRALILGAGLVTAGRVVAGGRGREMLESLQHRVGQNGDADDEDYVDAEGDEDFDEEPEAEEDSEDEAEDPEDEGSEDFEEEDDDEPEAQGEEEPEAEGEELPEATGEEELDEGDEEEPPAKPARRRAGASRSRGRARA